MEPNASFRTSLSAWILGILCFAGGVAGGRTFATSRVGMELFSDPTGTLAVFSSNGALDSRNPFFHAQGTNGRSCETCHIATDAYTITPPHIQQRFAATNGTDPLFRPVDGANCPNSPGVNSNPPDPSAYSLLLNKGLIRVGMAIPANAQFTVSVVSDPYGCAETTDSMGHVHLSVYRRPLPSTNLRFLSAVMFDGRETLKPLNDPATYRANLESDLADQARDAIMTHEQGAAPPTQDVLKQIVDFEIATYSAQQTDNSAGPLVSQGADGGPVYLSSVPYYPGINDSLGGNPTGAEFDPNAFTLFSAWQNLASRTPSAAARASVARGQAIFNTAPLFIQNVKGLNDALGVATIQGACSTCHDAINSGGHSLPVPLDIGIADVPTDPSDSPSDALGELDSPLVPVFDLTCSTALGGPSNFTVRVTDPGRALITGHCADIGKVKGPVLRGLAGHAPYFQNGAADTLEQVVSFYNERFQMGLTANEQADLVNFLKSL
jgi:cytochrome c peroxidase